MKNALQLRGHLISKAAYDNDGPRRREQTPFLSALGALALKPVLADRITGCKGTGGDFGDILLTPQAMAAPNMIGSLGKKAAQRSLEG